MKGWSILECILVCLLLGAMASGLRSFYQELSSCRRLTPFARQISALIGHAGTQAAFHQNKYRIELTEEASSLALYEGDTQKQSVQFPKSATLTSSPEKLLFHESGVAQAGRVRLTTSSCACAITVSLRGRSRYECKAL